MKITVTMESADALSNAIHDAVSESSPPTMDGKTLSSDYHRLTVHALKAAGRFFRDCEHLTVELDTEAGTCVVVPVKP